MNETEISDEEKLKEEEFFLKESQRVAGIGSYKTDFRDGHWKSSEVLDSIFGIDEKYDRSVQGWLDMVHPDDRQELDNYLKEEVIAKRKPFNKEYRIVRKNDGETRWVKGLGEVDFDDKGNIVSMIGTIQDITDLKKIEDDLRKSKDELQAKYNELEEFTKSMTGRELAMIALKNKIAELEKKLSETK